MTSLMRSKMNMYREMLHDIWAAPIFDGEAEAHVLAQMDLLLRRMHERRKPPPIQLH